MGKPEAAIENYLRDQVKHAGGSYRKVNWQGRRGAPDKLIWWTFPRCAFVECKRPGEDVDWRSNQGREIRRMRADGWPVYVVNSKEQVDEVVRAVRNGTDLQSPA